MTESCPVCGYDLTETISAKVKGRGSTETIAIVECLECGTLWGEPREFYGVLDAQSDGGDLE